MELWIRNQNKDRLAKCENLDILDRNQMKFVESVFQSMKIEPIELEIMIIGNNEINLGTYKTKERALEILDEISNKIKNQYIVKFNCLIKPSDMMKEKEYLDNTYDGDFIMQLPSYEIEPINPNVIYYEMPKE